MLRMTKETAEGHVRSWAPGADGEMLAWGARMLETVSRACGGHVDPMRAWVKALEVSVNPYANRLLDAMERVPPKPELLPEGWGPQPA